MKAWDTLNEAPPVDEATAHAEARLGEADHMDLDAAVGIAQRISNSFPHLANKDEDSLAGYLADLSDVMSRHHPLVVQEVTAGANRIQLKSKWAPSAAELDDALNACAAKMFPNVQRARLAVAWHGARNLSQTAFYEITRSSDWHFCLKTKAGDRAMDLVREYMEQAQ
ncbi:MAG: hypothetical protein AAFU68_02810 [Pseudomonadota bacterium]